MHSLFDHDAGGGLPTLIGVDIGGTNLRVGVVDGLQVVHERRSHADFSHLCETLPPDTAWSRIVAITAEALQQTIADYPAIQAVGIGFPGFINPATGVVAQSPNLPGLLDVDLASSVSAVLGMPVVVENDATSAAVGEFALLQSPTASLIYVGLGTGVGGGLVYNGQPYGGQHGVAMEVGHIIVQPGGRPCGCGNQGCMEQYASASGVALSYAELTGKRLAADAIASLARKGDAAAQQAFTTAAVTLATTIANIVKVVDVGQVVIGGGVSRAWDLMEHAFHAQLSHDLIPVLRKQVSVQISQSGDQAGIIGAAHLAGRLLPEAPIR